MCDPLQFSGIFWVFSAMSQRLPTQYTFRKKWAVPSMADNYICTSKNVRQTLNLPYAALALFMIVPSAPFTIGIIVTFVYLWIFFISSARSWNLSTFSSAVRVFWSADTGLCRVHFCVSLCATVISDQLRLSRLSVGIVISQVSIYTLSDLGDLSNLIGSLSRTIQQYSPPSEWIMCELGVFPIFLENDLLKVDKMLGLTFFKARKDLEGFNTAFFNLM